MGEYMVYLAVTLITAFFLTMNELLFWLHFCHVYFEVM